MPLIPALPLPLLRSKEEAPHEFARFAMTPKTPYQRKTSFLRRNWISGLTAWHNPAMGNAASLPQSLPQSDDPRRVDGAPPLKRRRISSPEPFALDRLIAPPPPGPSESRDTLRVDVLKISHKDSKRVRSQRDGTVPRDPLTTKANCRITISDMTSGSPDILFCQSQLCDVTGFENPAGPHRVARIALPHPFFVPVDSILVNKPDGSFDLPDAYDVFVELRGVNDELWPPLNATSDPHCSMTTRCDRIFGRLKTPMTVRTGRFPDQLVRPTDYVVEIDLRWAAGFKTHKGSMPCITAIDPDAEPYLNGSLRHGLDDGVNGIDENQAQLYPDHEDDLDGDQTPSRSLRTRQKNKVYNLKVLSDQAQGRERKRRARARAYGDEGRVTYLLSTDQPVCLDFHRCVTCGAYHQSMLELQAHMKSVHVEYDYVLDTASQVPQFRVTRRYDADTSPSKTYQLGRQLKPFNLETFVAGDQSWLNSRLAPDAIDDTQKTPTRKPFLDRLQSGSPVTRAAPKLAQRPGDGLKGAKVLVPKTAQPMFHPISKAKLKPGQEVPKTVPDSGWLLQKHREAIGDFSDVDPPEKEYIREWDGYILQQNITTAAYFPRAWLGFVESRADWLVAAEDRMREFSKHLSVLFARDVLEGTDVDRASALIKEARDKSAAGTRDKVNGRSEGADSHGKADDEALRQSPRAASIRENANGCSVCQLPVLGPRMLVCSNKACSHRLYHADCIEPTAMVPVRRPQWLCNACSRAEGPS